MSKGKRGGVNVWLKGVASIAVSGKTGGERCIEAGTSRPVEQSKKKIAKHEKECDQGRGGASCFVTSASLASGLRLAST